MISLPVNTIHASVQSEGAWSGTPTINIRLMPKPDEEPSDVSWPQPDWEFDEKREISLTKLLAKRRGPQTPEFAYIGIATLANLVSNFQQKHVVLLAREPGRHDIEQLVKLLAQTGRRVQIETAGQCRTVVPSAWITLRANPRHEMHPDTIERADEVLVYVRDRADVARAEMIFGGQRRPLWIRPAPSAEPNMYQECLTAAARHFEWRAFR